MNNSPSFAVPLADLSVLRASGADAAAFLHGQLTQDITGLPPGQARLAGYCTPKGRLLGTLVICRDPAQPEDFVALVKADIAQALAKRLSMFILRAKAKLTVEPIAVWGVQLAAGQQAASLPFAPPVDDAPFSVAQTDQGTWIAAPRAEAGPRRWWLLDGQNPPTEDHDASRLAAWQAADIAAGLPWIQAATQDVFIPQTLNLDLIEGVNFTKGCYPGQEVVARSHYRGTIKRRMAYGIAQPGGPADSLAGSDIFDAARPESPSGRVVNAASGDGETHLLLEVHLADLGTAEYRLGSIQGPHIGIQPLPYHIDSVEAG
ncbi:YgfZ/GcvT domain-containing protein [Pusillimonas noertemannii]|uniref:Uncharacterized protein n=1 Tax=Pusillimonas noertemannii TaxID=305977 RepID=A0A2U1CJJ0_9BURK|nr:folate-binding protein YgfZ [Pusillimonas noertemannii]NYT69896.1 folate-binding protein YgfZ [Pusillimonas noertemannii]PVY61180.1 hypothetical protein C7440_2730 [Pusillimonas noertemannii]TFL09190.1 folate-binding protein [Pusillimonas noertemannii]